MQVLRLRWLFELKNVALLDLYELHRLEGPPQDVFLTFLMYEFFEISKYQNISMVIMENF